MRTSHKFLRSFKIRFCFTGGRGFILSRVASNTLASICLVESVHLHDVVLHGGAGGVHVHIPGYDGHQRLRKSAGIASGWGGLEQAWFRGGTRFL